MSRKPLRSPSPARLLAAALALALPAAASAQAPRPAAPAAPAARPVVPDPAYEAARAAFEPLPEDARRAVQDALVWTGDHNGVTTGGFGRRTYDSIVAYQRRASLPPTGILDDKARQGLVAAGAKARAAVGFVSRTDPATGAQIGVPERLLTRRDPIPNGARLRSADGKITLDLLRYPPGEAELPALFERASAATPERKVTYKVLRPDFLVVSGETPTGKFFIRHAAGEAGVRGFTLAYDKALAKDFDKIVIAVANSFVPFGAPATAAAAPTGAQAVAPAALPPPRPTATGLAVGPRRVLTVASAVEGCAEPRIGTTRARVVATDAKAGLALLELDADRRGTVPPLRSEALGSGASLVALAAATGSGLAALPAEAGAAGRAFAPLPQGSAGAPVLDRSGALVGLVASYPAAPRLVAGVVPPMSHPLVAADAVGMFLRANGLVPAAAGQGVDRTLGEVTAGLAGTVVAVECAR